MADRGEGAGTTRQGLSKRQQRAHRILDAAATLILRWGYNKTTIDDIARQAEVAKGTIYLHWKTREDLFRALVIREQLEAGRGFLERVAGDPSGATLRGIYGNTALAVMKSPLLKAFLLGDTDVTGKFVQRAQSGAAYTEKLSGFKIYLEFLRERGLVRTDITPEAQLYIATAIFVGFFHVARFAPELYAPSDEEMADMIGETVQRAITSGRDISPEELPTLNSALMEYLQRVWAVAEEQLRQEVES